MGIEVTDELTSAIVRAVREVLPEASYACLFGSLARGEAGDVSDVDVGVGIERDPGLLELGEIAGRIEDATHHAGDVVLLHRMPERHPDFAFRIASEGILLFETSRHAYADFKKRAFLYYLDTEPLRTLNEAALRRRVLSGNLGRRNYV